MKKIYRIFSAIKHIYFTNLSVIPQNKYTDKFSDITRTMNLNQINPIQLTTKKEKSLL